jgi:hypothetical protein
MVKPQHRTPEYVSAYKALREAQRAGKWHVCVEPVCKLPSRDIAPWQKASISHDPSGTVILGPSHLRCNLSEAARRGNQMRAKASRHRRLEL